MIGQVTKGRDLLLRDVFIHQILVLEAGALRVMRLLSPPTVDDFGRQRLLPGRRRIADLLMTANAAAVLGDVPCDPMTAI